MTEMISRLDMVAVCDDLIALAEEVGGYLEMADGPCRAEVLCGVWICENSGCIKDKADRARRLRQRVET